MRAINHGFPEIYLICFEHMLVVLAAITELGELWLTTKENLENIPSISRPSHLPDLSLAHAIKLWGL